MQEIVSGLWRWTAPHPAWAPGAKPESTADWDELVGCVLYECGDSVVFIDPLIPADAESFWRWADARVDGRRRVHVLTTLSPHRRSREEVARRYGASTSRARRSVPPEVHPIVLSGAAETMYWLPEIRTLVPGDRLLGAAGGGLRLCPESWLYWVKVDLNGLRSLLEPLLELPVERVVVSHGEPVLRGAHEALRRCLRAPRGQE